MPVLNDSSISATACTMASYRCSSSIQRERSSLNLPSTYKLNPKVPTSLDTPNSLVNAVSTGEKPDAPKETVRSTGIMTNTIAHFRHSDQFRGFPESSFAKITRYGSGGSWSSRLIEDVSLSFREGESFVSSMRLVDILTVVYMM